MVDEDLILVPSMRASRSFLSYEVGWEHRRRTVDLDCEDGKILEDQINVVNGRGEVLKRFPVLDAIALDINDALLERASALHRQLLAHCGIDRDADGADEVAWMT